MMMALAVWISYTSAYMNTMPAITLFAAYFFIGSTLSFKKILGIFIVTGAILLTASKDTIKVKLSKFNYF